MAFVVLLSTMSFTVSMHYCGDILVDTAIFHEAKGCGMEMQKPLSKGCAVIKKGCCNNEQLVIDGQDELQFRTDIISFDQQVFIASFLYSYDTFFKDYDKNLSSHLAYKPPLVIRQLYKIDEMYLI